MRDGISWDGTGLNQRSAERRKVSKDFVVDSGVAMQRVRRERAQLTSSLFCVTVDDNRDQ